MEDVDKSSQDAEAVQPEQAEVNLDTKQTEGILAGKKLIDENKKYRSQNRDFRQKLDDAEKKLGDFREQKLEEEGKFKEVSEFQKKRADNLEAKLKETQSNYGWNIITSQVKAKAAEMGCIDLEALVKLAPLNDLEEQVDEDFNIKPEAVSEMIDMMRTKRAWLFKKAAPKIEGGVPQQTPQLAVESKKDFASQLANMTRKTN